MRKYLDMITNRITMYRLMLYILMAMAAFAVMLATINILQFDAGLMTLGLAVLIVSCVVVNLGFTYMFGLPRRHESALISAFILFFIFSPPSRPSDLMILAAVAAIAMASKYLLVWRGRHVFNPSAAAAVIAGLIGLQFASWWIATDSMLVVTIIGGGLILYKTRRTRMSLLFVAVTVATTLMVALLRGSVLVDILPLLLTPIAFFAAFMLSEPLTLPPRNYQRIILASGVAVIIGLQIQVGDVYVAPEIALIIGNIYAFMCGQRGGIKLTLVGRQALTDDQVEYTFQPSRRLHFMAGQYVELQLPHAQGDARGIRRMFSITSPPTDPVVKICTRHYQPSSTFKTALRELPIGSHITATGIYGDFLLPDNAHEKVLLIAGGIGITPFHSQLEWLLQTRQARSGVLLYSVRGPKDAVYKDVLTAREHGIKTHIINGPIDAAAIETYAPDIAERIVYISGSPAMVDDVGLIAKHHGAKKLVKDYFSGY